MQYLRKYLRVGREEKIISKSMLKEFLSSEKESNLSNCVTPLELG